MSEFCCGATSVSPNSETSEDEEGEAESEERGRKLVDEENDMIDRAIAEADDADDKGDEAVDDGLICGPC